MDAFAKVVRKRPLDPDGWPKHHLHGGDRDPLRRAGDAHARPQRRAACGRCGQKSGHRSGAHFFHWLGYGAGSRCELDDRTGSLTVRVRYAFSKSQKREHAIRELRRMAALHPAGNSAWGSRNAPSSRSVTPEDRSVAMRHVVPSRTRPMTAVFLVGHVVHPDQILGVKCSLDGDMGHRRGCRGAVPVLVPGRAPDRVACANLHAGLLVLGRVNTNCPVGADARHCCSWKSAPSNLPLSSIVCPSNEATSA